MKLSGLRWKASTNLPIAQQEHPTPKRTGKFELFNSDKSGQYYFRLKAVNSEIIASSEGYKSKASALNGIESVRKNAFNAELVDLSVGE